MKLLIAIVAALTLVPVVAAQRRPALVTLRAPCLIEHLSASEASHDVARVRQRMLSREGEDYRAALRNAKAPLMETMRQRGITINSTTETVLNAITVEANDDDLAWLRAQPDVQSAEYAVEMHAALDAATKLTGAAQVWAQLGGASGSAAGARQTGAGIKVAMVDSGIDITNPMFNDTGFTAPAGFPKGDDATTISTYTNNKVIVAKNFVICTQDSNCNPTYDNTAADGYGHGSHTASIVGGDCVTSPASTTICGTAPGVFLGNYKVFDTTNSYSVSTWVLNAIDAAVADGMDVINFSGGSEHTGSTPATSQLYTPIHNAVAAGVPVAVCAGNCGPNGSTGECFSFGDSSMWAPAVSPDAISVGASTNSHAFSVLAKLQVLQPQSLAINANPGSSPTLSTALGPAPLVSVSSIDSTKLLCSAAPSGSLTGKVALVMRGSCTFAVKANNAAAGGAIAVVFYDSSSESLASFGINTGGATIPSQAITQSDGLSLESLASAGSVQVQLFPAAPVFTPQTADLVSSYSSRGPDLDYSIKPDVLAPGDVYAATQTVNNSTSTLYDASHFDYGLGTSYATPQVAGAAAILKQQRPTLTPHDIKSALVNTATAITATQDGSPAGVMQTGAGRLNIVAALATTLTADPVSLSFGVISSGNASSQSVTLKGVGSQPESFNVSVSQLISDSRVTVTPGSPSITVSPGQTVTLLVNFNAQPGATGVYEGFLIVASRTGSTSLRIPYWALLGTPTTPAGSLVDGAAFAPVLAPGGIASLFGSNLGGNAATASVVPLNTNLAHSQVFIVQTISGTTTTTATPLFYTSGGQVNFQMPYSLSAAASAQVYADVDGVHAAPLTFSPSAVAPQVFTTTPSGGATIGVVVHGVGGGLISASSPAAAGETVTIYCTGLGAVTPTIATGAGAPSGPLSTTVGTTTATLGSQPARVSFSGLSPSFVGLYQVNAVVPNGLSSGPQSLTLSVNGTASKSVTTFVQ